MPRRITALGAAIILLTAVSGLPGCDEDPPRWEPGGVHYSQCLSVPQSSRRKLDLLFVVDDSTAMAGFEDRLDANMLALGHTLAQPGEAPDMHVGVVTTVLGTGPHAVPGCSPTGHNGRLHRGTGSGPVGATYLRNVKPFGCQPTWEPTGVCSSHSCEAVHCEHAPGTWLVVDDVTGCPRCRNFDGPLPDAVRALAEVDFSDCGFSQPLEAMRLALESPENEGFRRDEAFLAVLFFSATDDCSAADPDLFAPEDSTLGPLTSFRCFEHGVTCAPDGREPGIRQDCHPREEAGGLVTPVGDYITYLQDLVDPQLLVVAGVMGPFDFEAQVTVELDGQGRPRLAPSCTVDATMAATPGVRLYTMLEAFNEEEDLTHWAQTSVCSADYTNVLRGYSNYIPGSLNPGCFALPLAGCTDPGAAYGTPGDDESCNDLCQPRCLVTDVQHRGMPDETSIPVPPCLEVCDDGPCPGNNDPTLAYASGHPEERDLHLPAPACWHARPVDWCSSGSSVVISRSADPPLRTFVNICCSLIPDVETLCDDGIDGDGDCLVDLDDPDCAG